MRTFMGWMAAFAFAVAIPTLSSSSQAMAKGARAGKSAAGEETQSMDEKVREHTKLRNQIAKTKYPASKAELVSRVKGIKSDDKKWFEQTLPDKTFASANEVYEALGWPTEGAAEQQAAGDFAAPGTTGVPSATVPSAGMPAADAPTR